MLSQNMGDSQNVSMFCATKSAYFQKAKNKCYIIFWPVEWKAVVCLISPKDKNIQNKQKQIQNKNSFFVGKMEETPFKSLNRLS